MTQTGRTEFPVHQSPVITNKPPIIQPTSGCFILDMRYSFCLPSENSININEAQAPSGTYSLVCCLLYLLPGQVWNGYPPLPEFLSAWALPEVKCLCLQDCGRDRGSSASLAASMSTQPGAQDERHLQGWRDIPIPVPEPLLGHTNLLPALVCPHLTQSHKQQLSHRGKIILSHKLALTAEMLIVYQICVLQNSPLEAGQAVQQV